MADISVIKMPDNSSYNLKDAAARQSIASLPTDVRVNGTSVVSNGIANIPMASDSVLGAVKIPSGLGIYINPFNGEMMISSASSANIKEGENIYRPISPKKQDEAVFFGLAKAANANMASIQDTTIGIYPNAQKQAIQNMLGITDLLSTEESSTAIAAHTINSLFMMDGKLHRATSAIAIGDAVVVGTNCEVVKADEVFIKNTDYADTNNPGLVKINSDTYGVRLINGTLATRNANESEIKSGTNIYKAIVPDNQHKSIYYGLSKLAGVNLANETVTVGTYPESSKQAIQSMLGISTGAILIENVSGSTPSITALPNVRYKCGEVSTLSITPPANGSCEVIFTSGSTATVLTVPNTVKFPPWFDATTLEANTTYEIIISDGVYGGVMSWAD